MEQRFEPGAAGSGSKCANHCAMLHTPLLQMFCFFEKIVRILAKGLLAGAGSLLCFAIDLSALPSLF